MCSVEKRGSVYILTLTGDGQHRINPPLIRSLKAALTQIRSEAEKSTSCCALVTTGQGKFFSNGYDLDWVRSAHLTQAESESRAETTRSEYESLIKDLIELPMPTIAAVTGHASAAGFILAMAHDYVVMRKDRGFLYMSELDIDLVVPDWFVKLVMSKVGSGKVGRRDVFLKAEKLTAERAAGMGLVDLVADGATATVEAAVGIGEEIAERKWKGHVYSGNRLVVMHDVLHALELGKERSAITFISRL